MRIQHCANRYRPWDSGELIIFFHYFSMPYEVFLENYGGGKSNTIINKDNVDELLDALKVLAADFKVLKIINLSDKNVKQLREGLIRPIVNV